MSVYAGSSTRQDTVNRCVCTWTCRNHDSSGHWVNDLQKVCLCMKELRQFLADVIKRPSTETSVHEYACAWRNDNIYQCSGITFINVQDRGNDLQITDVSVHAGTTAVQDTAWVNDLQKVCLCLKKLLLLWTNVIKPPSEDVSVHEETTTSVSVHCRGHDLQITDVSARSNHDRLGQLVNDLHQTSLCMQESRLFRIEVNDLQQVHLYPKEPQLPRIEEKTFYRSVFA